MNKALYSLGLGLPVLMGTWWGNLEHPGLGGA